MNLCFLKKVMLLPGKMKQHVVKIQPHNWFPSKVGDVLRIKGRRPGKEIWPTKDDTENFEKLTSPDSHSNVCKFIALVDKTEQNKTRQVLAQQLYNKTLYNTW